MEWLDFLGTYFLQFERPQRHHYQIKIVATCSHRSNNAFATMLVLWIFQIRCVEIEKKYFHAVAWFLSKIFQRFGWQQRHDPKYKAFIVFIIVVVDYPPSFIKVDCYFDDQNIVERRISVFVIKCGCCLVGAFERDADWAPDQPMYLWGISTPNDRIVIVYT